MLDQFHSIFYWLNITLLHKTGIHATIAGVVLGLIIPATPSKNKEHFSLQNGVDLLRECLLQVIKK